jgi:RNA polymerase sigma factor (TIGR02999 family)
MPDVTRLLSRIESGDPQAASELLPLLYDELRKLAAAKLVQERPGQTLDATALVHEAYLRLVAQPDGEKERQRDGEAEQTENRSVAPSFRHSFAPSLRRSVPEFHSRGHFFAAAAEAMRRILIERARRKGRFKHGGGLDRKDLDTLDVAAPEAADDLLALDEALSKLAATDEQAARLVSLRYFAGLSLPQVAQALDISPRTADRLWAYARAFLHAEIYEK